MISIVKRERWFRSYERLNILLCLKKAKHFVEILKWMFSNTDLSMLIKFILFYDSNKLIQFKNFYIFIGPKD